MLHAAQDAQNSLPCILLAHRRLRAFPPVCERCHQRALLRAPLDLVCHVSRMLTVGSGDTVASLARRMAYSDNQIDRFRVLNGLTSNEGLSVGQKVKIVVRGR